MKTRGQTEKNSLALKQINLDYDVHYSGSPVIKNQKVYGPKHKNLRCLNHDWVSGSELGVNQAEAERLSVFTFFFLLLSELACMLF